nr:hypothetical protein [uncultured Pseudomonas sp.]
MNKNKIAAMVLAFGLSQMVYGAVAAPAAQAFPCFRNSSQMPPGVAQPGEYKVIHSYTVNCGTTLHNLTVRTQRGAVQPVTVERSQGGTWTTVVRGAYDPSANWGGGSFRVILDNTAGKAPISYRGSFSLPL